MQERIIARIYEWNDRVDALRSSPVAFNADQAWLLLKEEYEEEKEARKNWDIEEIADALADQFIIAIWELRKIGIKQWSFDLCTNKNPFIEKNAHAYFIVAQNAWYALSSVNHAQNWTICDRILTEVIDKLFTRFGDDCYIDENNKFRRSSTYEKPNLSFLLK